jgi:Arc/MetJ family transcription regulator
MNSGASSSVATGTCGTATTSILVNLDDELVREAQRPTGMEERTALVREALRALIERESARRRARLGGSDRTARALRRRRALPASDDSRGGHGGALPVRAARAENRTDCAARRPCIAGVQRQRLWSTDQQ